jgi:Transglycosylase SLT domain
MTPNAPRRWVRRAMLSALAGGGLTAVGLGGALPGGALGAEATVGTSGSGGGETPPPATGTTTAPAPAQGGASEPTTTTSTSSSASSTSAAPPTTPPAPQGQGGSGQGQGNGSVQGGSGQGQGSPKGQGQGEAAPVVVVQRKQPAVPRRRGAKAGGKRGVNGNANNNVKANGGVGAGAKSNANGGGGPTTVPAGTPNGVAPPPLAVAGQAGTLASILGQSAVSAQALAYYRVPLFLLPIYQAAGIQYGVPWQILAAINEVETDYGNDLSVSTAGAVGWMQFMPTTWLQYGVDALGAGYADPYNPVDAIFAAARYLHAAGASSNLHTAILAYNHSEAYVSSVLLRAKLIASYPQSVIATLTGLTEGSLPVAGARVAQDPGTPLPTVANATAGAVALEPYAGAEAAAAQAPSAIAAAGAGSATSSPANPAAPSPSPPPAPGVVGRRAARRHAEELRFVDLLGPLGASVTAVQDGRIVKLGRSHKLGNYLALQDVYGDVFTYAGLGSIAHRYHEPGHPAKTKPVGAGAGAGSSSGVAGTAQTLSAEVSTPALGVPAKPSTPEPTPTAPASAGRQLPITLHVKTPAQQHLDQQSPEVEAESQQSSEEGAPPPGMGRVRLYAHPGNPVARVAAARAGALGAQSDGHGGRWLPLRQGSLVSQGTILGHLSRTPAQEGQGVSPLQAWGGAHLSLPVGGPQQGGSGAGSASTAPASPAGQLAVPVQAQSARLRFAIRPAGDSSTVDPRPILANWRQLDTALHPRGARADVNLLGATVAQVFLMSQSELERTVLSDPGISIYDCGRQDIAAGSIDGRVLAVLEFLSRSGLKPTVSALRCGHSEMTTSGNVSEHYFGDAMDISAINGVPIAGHQGAGSITDVTIRALLTLQGQFVPHQIISLMKYPEAANTLALPEHWNHIHVGFRPQPGTLAPSAGPGAAVQAIATAAHSAGPGQTAPSPLLAVSGDLSPAQWNQLVQRIGALQQPTVVAKPTSAAIRDPQAAAGNRDLGARALPRSGAEE